MSSDLFAALQKIVAQKPEAPPPTPPPAGFSLSDLLLSPRPSATVDVRAEASKTLEGIGRFDVVPTGEAPDAFKAPVIAPSVFKRAPKTEAPEPAKPTQKLSLALLDAMGIDPSSLAANSRFAKAMRKDGVSESFELERICKIPRRVLDTENYPHDLTDEFKKPSGTMRLRPVQSAMLAEARRAGGLLAPVAAGAGKCVSGDTEVYDPKEGRRRRVDEVGNLHVATMDDRRRVICSEATAFPSGVKTCLRLRADAGSEVVLSSDHPVLTPSGWKKAEDLRVGEMIASARSIPAPEAPLDISDEELCFVAYLMADGGTSNGAAVFVDDNPATLSEVASLVEKLGGSAKISPERSKAYRVNICGLSEIVKRWGLYKCLSKNKRLPERFYGLSDRHVALFLNRFIACDGHLNLGKPEIEISLSSKSMIEDLRFLFLRLGVLCRTKYKLAKCGDKHFDAWRLTINGRENITKCLHALGPIFGQEDKSAKFLHVCTSIKGNTNVDVVPITRKEYREICDELGMPKVGGDPSTHQGRPRSEARKVIGLSRGFVGREGFARFCRYYNYTGKYAWLADSDVFWDRVKSLDPVGEIDVFDLSVPATGCFVAGAIVVHNTLSSLLMASVMKSKRAVLLIPPALRAQLITKDIPKLGYHWKLPLDRLQIVAYSELSSAGSADILEKIKPDLIIADEVHALRYKSAARTKRFLRYMKEHPECRFVGMSGTITRRSIKDFAHLAELALQKNSPVPLNWNALEEWAEAIDIGKDPMPAGALVRLCTEEEQAELATSNSAFASQPIVRNAFRRRMVETPGVVATSESAIGTSLVITGLRPPVPSDVEAYLRDLRYKWELAGDELVDILAVTRVGCQLAAGFFYRWVWPNGVPDREWLEARSAWRKEVREILKRNRPGLDSPLLVENAVKRGAFESTTYAAWEAVKDRPEPPTEAVWINDYLVKDAIRWGRETCDKSNPGIIWCLHTAFAERLAKDSGFPYFGAGEKASQEIAAVNGAKTPVIIASQRAHGTGKNLQTFCRNLFTTPLGGTEFEQTLSRTHRPGQEADEVSAEVYVHTEEMIRSWKNGLRDAKYAETVQGQAQKLLLATRVNLPEDDVT